MGIRPGSKSMTSQRKMFWWISCRIFPFRSWEWKLSWSIFSWSSITPINIFFDTPREIGIAGNQDVSTILLLFLDEKQIGEMSLNIIIDVTISLKMQDVVTKGGNEVIKPRQCFKATRWHWSFMISNTMTHLVSRKMGVIRKTRNIYIMMFRGIGSYSFYYLLLLFPQNQYVMQHRQWSDCEQHWSSRDAQGFCRGWRRSFVILV